MMLYLFNKCISDSVYVNSGNKLKIVILKNKLNKEHYYSIIVNNISLLLNILKIINISNSALFS